MFIFPYNRDNQVEKTPWVVVSLIVVNSLLLALVWMSGPSEVLFAKYGFVPAHPELRTALTSMFLHAGFWHLFGNMWFLWMFGNQVENILGRWLFSFVYLSCGFGGALLHYFLNSHSNVPCVGASGAISGIAGCFFVLYPKANFDLVFYFRFWTIKEIHTHTGVAVGAWIGEQALLGLLSLEFKSFGVAFWAHVGGFVVGIVAGAIAMWLLPKRGQSMIGRSRLREAIENEDSLHLKI